MPGCGILTVGPSDESEEAVINIGVAAHIRAAAQGPRYDPNMAPAERKNIHNGIWLCANHSVEIDRDVAHYTCEFLSRIKREHEAQIAIALNAGRGIYRASDLIAIGPNITCVGELLGTSGRDWSIRIDHFVEGDLHELIRLSEQFGDLDPFHRYLLINAFGDGRQLADKPSWTRDGSGIMVRCRVVESFPRIDAHQLGKTLATNEANDIFLTNGGWTMVSGTDALPQIIKSSLSLLLGESPFHPRAGSRLKEYFDDFADSPWLRRLMKLEVIRLSSVPYRDTSINRPRTPLQSVLRVDDVQLLDTDQQSDWRKVRFALDVKGIGSWQRDIPIFIPRGERPPRPSGWEQIQLDVDSDST